MMRHLLFISLFSLLTAGFSAHGAETEGLGLAGSYLSGQFARSSGDTDVAIASLRRIYHNNPDNDQVGAELMALLLVDGDAAEAIKIAERLEGDAANDTLVILLRALRAVHEEQFEQAATELDRAFEAGATQPWLPLIAAWVDVQRKPPAKPLAMEDLSGNVGRMTPLVHYHLALINEYAGFIDAGTQHFLESIENPERPPARIMERLLAFYEKHGSPAALHDLVETYRNARGEDEQASASAAPIANISDGIAEVLLTMGSVMRTAGMAQDAAVYLRLAQYVKPDAHVAMLLAGDAYSDLGRYEKANAAYATIPVSDANYGKAQLRAAINLDRLGKTPATLKKLNELAAQPMIGYDALLTKADILRMRGRMPEAVAAYSQAIDRQKPLAMRHWSALFARAACYESLGEWKKAEADLKQALELNPDQPEVLNFLGYSWLMRGHQLEEATAMIARALEAKPGDAQILDSMGWALYLNGRYDEAAGYLEKAVALLPGDSTVNDHLGDVYWRQGRKNEARFQWDRSLTFAPEASLAKAIRRKLKEGLPESGVASKETPVATSAP